MNHYYASIKPARFRFNLNLEADESIKDLISAFKKERPGQRGVSVFPKWSLQGLLDYLNSGAFEPLEDSSFRIVRCKLLILICLNTGRRVCEIAAISDFSFRRNEVVFTWFPGFLAKMEKDFGSWKSDPPKISPIVQGDTRLCPVRAFRLFLDTRPEKRDPVRLWLLRKSAISCLVRNTIKASFEFAPRSHAGESDSNTKVSVHDLRKFACSYSRKYLYRSSKSLAKRVVSKSFSTLDNCYIRDVPRVRATFQVPLGTIKPMSTAYHRLRTD